MMGDAWFVPKRYGYGASPANWKGWVFLAVMVAILIAARIPLVDALHAWFGLVVAIWFAAVVVVVRAKGAGAWRWRWGNRDEGSVG